VEGELCTVNLKLQTAMNKTRDAAPWSSLHAEGGVYCAC